MLWRLFVEFEIRTGQLKKAKDVLFRAIAQCPGVKGTVLFVDQICCLLTILSTELYVLAFDTLRDVFAPHELTALGETMAERGIRMRTGVDEIVQGMEIDEDKDSEEESGQEDEVEYNARELRRLKPY